jgi:serine/threonine-protein kinase
MPTADALIRTDSCLSEAQLVAFLLGRLPEQVLWTAAEHLSGCRRCADALGELDDEDSVVSKLRRCGRAAGPPGEPEYQQFEERVRAVALVDSVVGTVPDGQGTASTVVPEREAPVPFGPYELLEQLGSGGMGEVHKARLRSINRTVALKILLYVAPPGSEARARFQTEGEAIGRLRHPNVIPMYEWGEHDGRLYFSMEYAEGGSLASQTRGQPQPPKDAARLVEAIARGAHAAHLQRVIHRDLKPGNVLLSADGTPKIGDFGLAKLLDADSGLTQTEAILGTPAYMAPEQARGEARRVGVATDVWALGAILYELLTGQSPFRGEGRHQTLEMVKNRDPVPPTRVRPEISPELEAICLKCLEKEPPHRYVSAEALADDLDRWLHEQQPKVRPPGWGARLWRRVSRRPRVAAAVLLLPLLALAAMVYVQRQDPDRPIKAIEARLKRGEKVVLIGDTGGPRWSRWRTGEEAAQAAVAADGMFTVRSWTLSLLELVRDPQRDRFRIRAEVRHDQSYEEGEVGLYFARQQYTHSEEPLQLFMQLTFNDVRDEVALFHRAMQGLPKGVRLPPPPKGNQVQLVAQLSGAGAGRHRGQGLKPVLFQAAGLAGGPWRTVTAEVGPDEVHALWEGTREVGKLSAGQIVSGAQNLLLQARKQRAHDPQLMQINPHYNPRAPLGIYVRNGSAAFRNVTVEPLGEGD